MSTIGTLLQFSVLASAVILAFVWCRLCVPRHQGMRFLDLPPGAFVFKAA